MNREEMKKNGMLSMETAEKIIAEIKERVTSGAGDTVTSEMFVDIKNALTSAETLFEQAFKHRSLDAIMSDIKDAIRDDGEVVYEHAVYKDDEYTVFTDVDDCFSYVSEFVSAMNYSWDVSVGDFSRYGYEFVYLDGEIKMWSQEDVVDYFLDDEDNVDYIAERLIEGCGYSNYALRDLVEEYNKAYEYWEKKKEEEREEQKAKEVCDVEVEAIPINEFEALEELFIEIK